MMKASNCGYSVSVQWGAGRHYFVGYYATREETQRWADFHTERCERIWKANKKRGAQPAVYIWERS